MIKADVAMFSAVSHYFAGIAQLHLTKQNQDERNGLREAAPTFRLALNQLSIVKESEKKLLELARPIEYSAYYVRRHEVVSFGTTQFRHGLELLIQDLAEGYYPLKGFTILNPLMARLMAGWDLNARVEGVITRIERAALEPKEPAKNS